MKTMTCNELGGACEKEFSAATWPEMVELSKAHGMEMFMAKDPAHMAAIGKMQVMMQDPAAMQKWFAEKQKAFEAL